MFKKKSDKEKMQALINFVRKDAFDAGFSYGWDAAIKALMDRMAKKENRTEENELQWEAMTNGRSTNPSEEN